MAQSIASANSVVDQVRQLQSDMQSLQQLQPKKALAKGEAALALLASAPDPVLEFALTEAVTALQMMMLIFQRH